MKITPQQVEEKYQEVRKFAFEYIEQQAQEFMKQRTAYNVFRITGDKGAHFYHDKGKPPLEVYGQAELTRAKFPELGPLIDFLIDYDDAFKLITGGTDKEIKQL